MSFIHPYLLFGLLLAGVPVLLHLIMRQKPKRLPFPAFRFLKQRYRLNQRKLNLQNILLLLLRVAVICALCLALSRPRLFADRLGASADRAVIAVLVFDTSPSMEYTAAGLSRLDDAKGRGRELVEEMDAASRVAVFDSGDDGNDALLPLAEARSRIDALRIRPGASSLNRAVDRGLRLLEQQAAGEETPPRLLVVFSDRTRASWDEAGVKPVLPEGVKVVYVDVGVEKPRDLGIDSVEVIPAVVAPGTRYEVRVKVRGTLGGHDNELTLAVDGDSQPPEKRPVSLAKDYSGDVFSFERTATEPPADGPLDVPYQLAVRLGTRDALTINNSRHATFTVRRGRKLLTIVEKPATARVWNAIHAATRSFANTVQTPEQALALDAKPMGEYSVICLFQIANVPDALWAKLAAYVKAGGGLAIVPGGDEMLADVKAFDEKGKALLPAPLLSLASAGDKPVQWERFTGSHPILARFVAWARGADPDFEREELRPFVRRYWKLDKLAPEALVLARYADAARSPALVERPLGNGRILLFTTPLDLHSRQVSPDVNWTNYMESSFALVLIDRVCLYLGGETVAADLGFRCGVVPSLTLPVGSEGPFTLAGPGLSGAERNVRQPANGPLTFPQAILPGNYRLLDAKEKVVAGFSLDVAAVETDLERLPAEQMENALGPGSVLPSTKSLRLREAISGSARPPLEMLPYLMMALLLVLTVESLLANRFYRRTPEEAAPVGPDAT